MSDLLSLDDALAIISKVINPIMGQENCALSDALYRVTASSTDAPYALPLFTNTAVDGYAFTHAGPNEKIFKIVGASFAGAPFTGTMLAGEAVRIATGAILPEGADTVVMQENCRVEGGKLFINILPTVGANVRSAGADIRRGAPVISNGHRLQPQDIALIGALGFTNLRVRRRLRIAIVSTGQELAEQGSRLQPGQIIDTNGLMLRHLLHAWAPIITMLPPLPDDYNETLFALKAAAVDHDLVISTGGVSVGSRDYIRDAICDAGKIHFWKLAIRPGRPVMVGQIGDCVMAGLPGNPVSAFVTYFIILEPLIQRLYEMPSQLPFAYPLPLTEKIIKSPELRSFSRAKLECKNGMLYVQPYHDQSSNLLTSLTTADGLLDLPADVEHFDAGDDVLFRPYRGLC